MWSRGGNGAVVENAVRATDFSRDIKWKVCWEFVDSMLASFKKIERQIMFLEMSEHNGKSCRIGKHLKMKIHEMHLFAAEACSRVGDEKKLIRSGQCNLCAPSDSVNKMAQSPCDAI